MAKPLILLVKSAVPGGAIGDLFDDIVPVAGHMRGATFVRPNQAVRHKRHETPPSLADFDDDQVIGEAKLRLLAQLRSRRQFDGEALTNPQAVKDFLSLHIADRQYETFGALFLDTRHRVIDLQELFRGTIDGASVHPREVVKEALAVNAAAVIFAHNHPSGVAEPSNADINITRRLKEALSNVDVRVLDHIVVGEGQEVSLAERGLL